MTGASSKQGTQSQCSGTTQGDVVRREVRGGVQDGGTHVHPWLIHIDVWQKPPHYPLIKINKFIFLKKKLTSFLCYSEKVLKIFALSYTVQRYGHKTCFQVKVLDAQSCPTLCDPMGCSPPGSSVHGILQASKKSP